MRKQYFFRASPRGPLAWDVDRLVRLSANLPRKEVSLAAIRELETSFVGEGEVPTWKALLEHVKLIEAAELEFPIILAANGEVMDGRHRIAKAALAGRSSITAVQFAEDPEPDYVGRGPDELPY